MKRVLAALAVVAVSSFSSMVNAAEGEAPVVKGNMEVYGAATLHGALENRQRHNKAFKGQRP